MVTAFIDGPLGLRWISSLVVWDFNWPQPCSRCPRNQSDSSWKKLTCTTEDLKTVRPLESYANCAYHVKLEICSFVMNFNSRGFSLRVLYCVIDTGYGLGRSLRDCRPALPEGRKYHTLCENPEIWTGQNRSPIPQRSAKSIDSIHHTVQYP